MMKDVVSNKRCALFQVITTSISTISTGSNILCIPIFKLYGTYGMINIKNKRQKTKSSTVRNRGI